VLLERARTPGAARREVDTLLRGLALPLPPGEDARARADLLHDILEDRRVRAFTGSNGRRVAHAAVDALEALGSPSALEIPPELLAEARAARPAPALALALPAGPPPVVFHILGWILFTPSVLIGSVYYLTSVTGPLSFWTAMTSYFVVGSVGAALVASLAPVVRVRWLHWLLLLLAATPGLLSLKISVPVFFDVDWHPLAMIGVVIPLAAGGLQVVGALCLYCPPPPEESSAPGA